MNYYHPTYHAGYSLVEVLVAIAVLLIALVGPMSIAAQGIKSAAFTLEQNSASFFAQEGIEAVFSLRGDAVLQDVADGLGPTDPDTSWDWLNRLNAICGASDPCTLGMYFNFTAGKLTPVLVACGAANDNCRLYKHSQQAPQLYTHVATGGEPTLFRRTITIDRQPGNDSVAVTVLVRWNSHVYGGAERTVELHTYLFDAI